MEQALIKAGRTDLIGDSPSCLIRPSQKYRMAQTAASKKGAAGRPGNGGKKSPIRSINNTKNKKKGKKS